MAPAGSPNVLCLRREAVPNDLPAGTPVFLIVENLGESARRVRAVLGGRSVSLASEPGISAAQGFSFITYNCVPSELGKPQVLELFFETISGHQDTHLYQTVHGKRILQRIDPA